MSASSTHNEHRDRLEHELRNVGIKPDIERNGNGNMRIRWVSGGKIRSVLTSWTPSDYRSTLNARAHIRRVLREDGLLDKPKEERPAPLAKALSVPAPQETSVSRIERLEHDIDALLDIVSDLTSKLVALGVKLDDEIKPEPTEAHQDEPKKKKRTSSWRHEFLLCLEHQAQPFSVIMKRSGCESGLASVRLNTLKKEGIVENPQRGMWRKKIAKPAVNGKSYRNGAAHHP